MQDKLSDKSKSLHQTLASHTGFKQVVLFNAGTDKLLRLNFTASNNNLDAETIADTAAFSHYIAETTRGYKYGIGGYNELRTLYARSVVFDDAEEPRRLHLGIDIWGPAGTPVFAPLTGIVHSFAFNDHFGDYGATIILRHQLEGQIFYTLYGHLSLGDIKDVKEGLEITAGQEFAHFGEQKENGHWPPHLHFQIIENIGDWKGDYPGVCKFSEREYYLQNSPDADLVLGMMKYAE